MLEEEKQERKTEKKVFAVGKGKEGHSRWGVKRTEQQLLEKEILETKRVVKVTKGGRRFSFSGLILAKNPEKKSIAFAFVKSKEMSSILRKALFRVRKKMINYFPNSVSESNVIPAQILVKYKSTRIFIKPTPQGSGIKAGGVLNVFFKYLGIENVSSKIIGSRNRLNVIKAAFLALEKLTGKRYVN